MLRQEVTKTGNINIVFHFTINTVQQIYLNCCLSHSFSVSNLILMKNYLYNHILLVEFT